MQIGNRTIGLTNQPFVIDHIAKPLIKEGIIEDWANNIKKVGKFVFNIDISSDIQV